MALQIIVMPKHDQSIGAFSVLAASRRASTSPVYNTCTLQSLDYFRGMSNNVDASKQIHHPRSSAALVNV